MGCEEAEVEKMDYYRYSPEAHEAFLFTHEIGSQQ